MPALRPDLSRVGDQAAFADIRRRATSAAAAAPNSRTLGGAGTGAGSPLLDPLLVDDGGCGCQPWLELQPLELEP